MQFYSILYMTDVKQMIALPLNHVKVLQFCRRYNWSSGVSS